MEVISIIWHTFINIHIFIIFYTKSFFLLFGLSNSVAAFLTGQLLIITTLAIFSRTNTFVEAFKNYGVWIVALILNAILLWLTNDLSIDFTEEGRKAANTSIFSFVVAMLSASGRGGYYNSYYDDCYYDDDNCY